MSASRASGLFITGTDTGVGKTATTCALLRVTREAGLDVGAMKPAESGCSRDASGNLVPADAVLLREATGNADPLEEVCLFRLEAPLAPGIAAAREGVAIELGTIRDGLRQLTRRHADGLAVEGAGGWLVPLTPGGKTIADLAVELGLPVLVIARTTLGTINHTALTVEAIRARGLEVRGIVLNGTVEADDSSVEGNAAAIEQLTGVRVVAVLPHVRALSPEERIDRLVPLLRDEFQVRGVEARHLFRGSERA